MFQIKQCISLIFYIVTQIIVSRQQEKKKKKNSIFFICSNCIQKTNHFKYKKS